MLSFTPYSLSCFNDMKQKDSNIDTLSLIDSGSSKLQNAHFSSLPPDLLIAEHARETDGQQFLLTHTHATEFPDDVSCI